MLLLVNERQFFSRSSAVIIWVGVAGSECYC